MSKLDPQAVEIASNVLGDAMLERILDPVLDRDLCITKAISAFRQAECKPFKDALDVESIREGAPIEVYHCTGGRPYWQTVTYSALDDIWIEYPGSDWSYPHDDFSLWHSHYRIPFNPEEGLNNE